MKNNKTGFSLPLAMGLVIIISLLAMTILEYIIPFSRDIKGVENSSKAYYLANSGIEEGLYDVYKRNNSGAIDNTDEYLKLYDSTNTTYKYNTYSSGTTLPPAGEGNSEDKDWNTISSGNPIQLSIGNGYITDGMKITFDISNNTLTLSGSSFPPYLPIVNWQLSSTNDTLNASGSIITAEQIDGNEIDLFASGFEGVNLNGNPKNITDFYNANCNNYGSGCTLKFSVINKLETDDTSPITIPYLKWKITTGTSVIPLRYSKIESSGKSYGYKKDLEVKIAGNTVNEAFDFTVFQ